MGIRPYSLVTLIMRELRIISFIIYLEIPELRAKVREPLQKIFVDKI
jgi:hypothetical protein